MQLRTSLRGDIPFDSDTQLPVSSSPRFGAWWSKIVKISPAVNFVDSYYED